MNPSNFDAIVTTGAGGAVLVIALARALWTDRRMARYTRQLEERVGILERYVPRLVSALVNAGLPVPPMPTQRHRHDHVHDYESSL